MRHILQICLVSLTIIVAGNFIPAEAQVDTVNLSGMVLDPSGAAIPSAKVTIKKVDTGATRSADADAEGSYSFIGLSPGNYELTAEAPGFNQYRNPVILTVGQSAEADIRLEIGPSNRMNVEVTSAAQLIETQRTAVAETVGTRQINDLPIDGRNYTNFALLDSQVSRDSAPSIGAAPTSGMNIGGQRARANGVYVDGANAVDNSTNGIRSTVSQEGVQEFQLILSNYNAEFGQATGGVINIVTKGGGNTVHGDVFGFLRSKYLQARNPFSVEVDPATGSAQPVKQSYTRVQ